MSPKRTLERLKYKILPAVGSGSFPTEGTVADLLFDIPYFFLAKIIPPIDVVNEVLQKGVMDAGMSGGCKWKPLQLDAKSYAELAAYLRQLDFVNNQPPDWVKTHPDWHCWCAELVLESLHWRTGGSRPKSVNSTLRPEPQVRPETNNSPHLSSYGPMSYAQSIVAL